MPSAVAIILLLCAVVGFFFWRFTVQRVWYKVDGFDFFILPAFMVCAPLLLWVGALYLLYKLLESKANEEGDK